MVTIITSVSVKVITPVARTTFVCYLYKMNFERVNVQFMYLFTIYISSCLSLTAKGQLRPEIVSNRFDIQLARVRVRIRLVLFTRAVEKRRYCYRTK